MNWQIFLLIFVSVGLSALAQLAFKLGMSNPAVKDALASRDAADIALKVFLSPQVIMGLAAYGVGALLWLLVLSKADISFAYPFVGIGFILTMLLGYFVLHEAISPIRIAGTLCVIVGVVLIARG